MSLLFILISSVLFAQKTEYKLLENIEEYGGDTQSINVVGYSAEDSFSLMVGLDKEYLAKYGIDADNIKGLISIGG